MPALSAADLALPPPLEGSDQVRRRVAAARAVQTERYAEVDRVTTNAAADGALLESVAAPDERGRGLLKQAVDRLRLSARGYHRVLKVARTLADLEGAAVIAAPHIAEALSYRRIAPRAARS